MKQALLIAGFVAWTLIMFVAGRSIGYDIGFEDGHLRGTCYTYSSFVSALGLDADDPTNFPPQCVESTNA